MKFNRDLIQAPISVCFFFSNCINQELSYSESFIYLLLSKMFLFLNLIFTVIHGLVIICCITNILCLELHGSIHTGRLWFALLIIFIDVCCCLMWIVSSKYPLLNHLIKNTCTSQGPWKTCDLVEALEHQWLSRGLSRGPWNISDLVEALVEAPWNISDLVEALVEAHGTSMT